MRIAPFIGTLALFATPLFADTVFLTNGATVEGARVTRAAK